ncbi:hypothetical protein D5018_16455 [Parashewanella curva]|uniref:Uncharacterized protein n=1 Tax=Parashewanella curva TaxID=2338552 RepID=A0A3L8PT83_9GAMM|nr:hypothetical protein [Parashewanella curva]RLV58611.1 hypothetical protein D5018_16455 [Parashewanella curva]
MLKPEPITEQMDCAIGLAAIKAIFFHDSAYKLAELESNLSSMLYLFNDTQSFKDLGENERKALHLALLMAKDVSTAKSQALVSNAR